MDIQPKDRAEQISLFRSEIIGALTRRELDHGELQAELEALSKRRFRPPGGEATRTYSIPTLERWYYRYRKSGLDALRPQPRSDRGRAIELTAEQRKLLLDIRREHRSASVPVILRTLIAEGRLNKGAVSAATVRRLYVEHGLDRVPMRDGQSPKTRLRWQAEQPGALWHADVCHGPNLVVGEQRQSVRIHALLDDASRYIVALEAMHTERENDMLALLVRALRRHPAPDVLYLDNGSTYRGEVLRLGCERLGITLLHAAPYDPEARGKMERFWGTMRSQCLDFVGQRGSLHDVNVRLWAWLDQHYHVAPHAGLLGKTPGSVWSQAEASRQPDPLDERRLRDALTVRARRRVRRDTTVSVEGTVWELDQGFLAGRIVTIAWCLIDDPIAPWVEVDNKRLELHPVDPHANSRRRRPPRRDGAPIEKTGVRFDPPQVLLDRAAGRNRHQEEQP
jgi:putative transposase